MPSSIIIATHNKGKLKEFIDIFESENLDCTVKSLESLGYDKPIIEDKDTFQGNALVKAQAIAKAYPEAQAILADDSGLSISYLNGDPGVYSARYAGEHASDQENIDKVLENLKDIPLEKRQARFETYLALLLPTGYTFHTKGSIEGYIALVEKGENGFGYDPIFLPNAYDGKKTMAELSAIEKNKISHRGQAIHSMIPYLKMITEVSR